MGKDIPGRRCQPLLGMGWGWMPDEMGLPVAEPMAKLVGI